MSRKSITDTGRSWNIKKIPYDLYHRFRSLKGDPKYVASGMAIGVFVAATPTIPFHMIISIALAIMLRASKPAALIGSWFSNPLTVGPIYYSSYKLGIVLLGRELPFDRGEITIRGLLHHGLDVTVAMVAGGAVLGVVAAVVFYFGTLFLFRKIRAAHRRSAVKDRGKAGAEESPAENGPE